MVTRVSSAWSIAVVLGTLAGLACAAPGGPAPSDSGAAATPRSAATAAPASGPAAGEPAAAPQPTSAAAASPATVRYAIQHTLNDGPVYLATERGYFAEEGLTIEFSRVQAAGEAIPLLATGQLDATLGAAAAALYNAIARGADVRIVADGGSTLPGFPLYSLAVRKDLVDSGQVADWKDLKGLRIANTAAGNGLHRGIDVALQKGGNTMADVEMPTMATPDMLVAFANRSIDAAPLFEPYGAQGEEQGALVRWKRSDEIFDRLQGGVVMYSPQFAQDQRDAARRFVLAYVRGARDYNDAYRKDRDRAGVNAVIARGVGLRDAAILDRVYPAGIDPDGYADPASLKANQDWYAANGYVQTTIDMDRVLDNSFVDYAVERLGRYQR